MSKRWAAWPQGIRWLVGIAAVVLALAIVWALFVPVADWLAHHDVGSAKGSLHETALDNARGRLLTLGAGLFAAGALIFTALNFNLLRRNSEQADQWQRRTYELTEQGQVTDRYTKAIEQLGSRQARRADRRHLRPGARRPRLRQRPPDCDGGADRIYPRALTRAVASARPSCQPGTGTSDPA